MDDIAVWKVNALNRILLENIRNPCSKFIEDALHPADCILQAALLYISHENGSSFIRFANRAIQISCFVYIEKTLSQSPPE